MENFTNNTNFQSDLVDILDMVDEAFSFYIIRVMAGIGIVTNVCFLIILSENSLKHRFYNNLWIKTFFDLGVCIGGVANFKSLSISIKRQEFKSFFDILLFYLNRRFIYFTEFCSILSEIYLILNRCIILHDYKSNLFYFKKRYVISFICLFSILIITPLFLSHEIVQDGEIFRLELTDHFGRTLYFKIYLSIFAVIAFVIPVITLIVITTISVIKFRSLVAQSRNLDINVYFRANKIENRFSKATIILSCTFAVLKIFLCIILILFAFKRFLHLDLSPQQESLLNLFSNFVVFLEVSFHVFNNFLYIYMDSEFRRVCLYYKDYILLLFRGPFISIFYFFKNFNQNTVDSRCNEHTLQAI